MAPLKSEAHMLQVRGDFRARPIGNSAALSTAIGVIGAVITIAAMLAGVVLALVFAATLVVVMVLATVLLGLAALAWRAQPRPVAQRASVRARAGHAWITYDWDGARR